MSHIENFLTSKEEQDVIEAIRLAELNTSGEIRVHLENCCEKESKDRALEVFSILKMHNTEQHNAVLIYIAVHDKSFVVYGDKGIDKVVTTNFWNSTKDVIQEQFKKRQFTQGLIRGIEEIGKQLKTHFPWSPNDENELTNTISKS